MRPIEDPEHRLAHPNLGEGAGSLLRASRWSRLGLVLLLILVAALPYANTLRNGFVYDDPMQIVDNPYIQDFRHLREIFTTSVWSYLGDFQATTSYYRPAMLLGYLFCYRLFGPRPFGFHLANLVVNVGVVCLLFLLTQRMFHSHGMAFVAAAMFALHPVHTEPVAWIAGITELEVAFFYLLTFWFFLRTAEPGEKWAGVVQMGMAGSFVGAMLSKEQALTLPLLATVYEHLYREDSAKATWAQKLSRYGLLWLLALAYLVIRARFLGSLVPNVSRSFLNAAEVFFSGLALVAQYFWKLLWPVRLCAYYVFPDELAPLLPWTLGGVVALAFSALLFALLWRHGREASFGVVWFLVTLAPVLNARWMPGNVFTERYLYLPSVGFCWVVAWTVVRWWRTPSLHKTLWRGALGGAACLITVLCVYRIVTRNRDWRDDVTLYRRTLAVSPDANYIHNNLGGIYWQQGNVEAAEQEWRQALELAPYDVRALHNLGMLAKRQKRYEEAIGFFFRALSIQPDFAAVHLDLGETYREMGMPQDAELQFRAAVALSPLSFRTRNALGNFYLETRRLPEAEEQFRRSLEGKPTRDAYLGLGFVCWIKGDREPAERFFKSAEVLDPSGSLVHTTLGSFYAQAGRTAEAVREYEAVLQADPSNLEAQAALKKLESQAPHAKQ
jgi:tetratricopeptide (TPR) repeat protein